MGRGFSKCIQDICCKIPQSENDAKNTEVEKFNLTLLGCDTNSNNSGNRSFLNICKKSAIHDVKVLQKYNGSTGLQILILFKKS